METESMEKKKLLDFLDYRDPINVDYILNKRHVTIGPESGSIYDPAAGSRIMRFKLASNDWLEPGSVSINFTLNATANNVAFFKEPHAFFRRCRLLSKGVLIEDITEFNRVEQANDLQRGYDSRNSRNMSGVPFAGSFGIETSFGANIYKGVQTGKPITVNFKPTLGLFTQNLLLPLRYLDLTLELELSAAADPVVTAVGAKADFTDTPAHTFAYTITNPTIKMNVISLDTAVANRFTAHLLGGGTLSVPFVSTTSSLQTVTNEKAQVNVSRALSHLKKMIVSYDVDIPSAAYAATDPLTRFKYYNKPWSSFWAPRNMANVVDGASTIPGRQRLVADPSSEENGLQKLQVMIGSRSYPDYPVESISEAHKYFLECCENGETSILQREYYNDNFLFGLNFQNNKESKLTGMNIKNQPIIIQSNTSLPADRMHVILYNESILEISDTNVSVYD